MNNFKYNLERGSKKHLCPSCRKKRFVRYVDAAGYYLPEQFGRCDREVKCGYFLKPSRVYQTTRSVPAKISNPERVFIPLEIMKSTRSHYHINSFVQFLTKLFEVETVRDLIKKYNLGTTKHFNGGCIFWFIDKSGNICYGQVKKFNPDGHSAKDQNGNQLITGVHYLVNEPWATKYQSQDAKISCLYGEHLLKKEPLKPIALVEAPKTAIIASVYYPDFLWLAVGGLSYLSEERTKSLQGREVILFPDLGCFDQWKAKGDKFGFYTSNKLELIKSNHDKGLDIADYLTRFNVREFYN